MKNYISLLLLTIFCCAGLLAQSGAVVRDVPKNLNEGLNDLSAQISKDLTENQKRRIAVIEFVDLKGDVTDFGRYLSEKLITNLFRTKKFTVVERQLLNKVIAEQKLSLTGIIDASTAQKLGKLLGVDAIAAGSISDLTKSLEINARLISTETGEVFSAASVQILKDETVCNLMGDCGVKPTPTLTPQATPKKIPIKPKTGIVESNFFTFELHRCRFSGGSVICEFTITNNDQDRSLKIGAHFGYSKMFDELNNESEVRGAEIANSGKRGDPQAFLVNGIATPARIYFEKVSSNATKITRMDIKFYPQGGKPFYIQYRNIPLRENVQSQNFDTSIRQKQNSSITEFRTEEKRNTAVKNDNYLQFIWTPPGEFMIGSPSSIKEQKKIKYYKNLSIYRGLFQQRNMDRDSCPVRDRLNV